jgi:KUP system potassium uptake protein
MQRILGIIDLVHYPLIFKAFNLAYAIMVQKSVPNAFIILWTVFLYTTGAEALYSDL